ncbi:hypothetical protein DAERI_100108 [Deinococcus aerius]|uniref:Uncharacterized protein n=1 Tax=Deinococcus aerius TaxID=200253 RepID=A0A2I9E034_9DEIO|nr:hypothetical protein [Deinococcus aerius]GBF06745.1 hypothetical protein DAERI_100108 [Deinococcus aerius]
MGRLWGRRGHAAVDYLTAPALFVLARRTGLRGTPLRLADTFAALILLAVTTTRTPLGVVPLVPFRWHGRAELVSVLVQYALPWLAGFSGERRARGFFLGLATYNLLVWWATDWAAPEPAPRPSRKARSRPR